MLTQNIKYQVTAALFELRAQQARTEGQIYVLETLIAQVENGTTLPTNPEQKEKSAERSSKMKVHFADPDFKAKWYAARHGKGKAKAPSQDKVAVTPEKKPSKLQLVMESVVKAIESLGKPMHQLELSSRLKLDPRILGRALKTGIDTGVLEQPKRANYGLPGMKL